MDASGDHYNPTLSTASIHACSCLCTCIHGLESNSLGMGNGRKLALQKEVKCLLYIYGFVAATGPDCEHWNLVCHHISADRMTAS